MFPLVSVIFFPIANRPTDFWRIGFCPPAVEDTAIEATVVNDLHAAGAAGFLRAARVVQPHVYALYQITPDKHVIIFQEDDLLAELRHPRDTHNFLDKRLAAFIVRVCFAGKEDLYRVIRVIQQCV